MLRTVGCLLAGFVLLVAGEVPEITEQFITSIVQYSDTNEVVVNMTMGHDLKNNRGFSNFFGGAAFPQPLEELDRFDIDKFFAIAGPSGEQQCQERNMTGSIGVFFDFPKQVTREHNETVNGRNCAVWSYQDLNNTFKFYGAPNTESGALEPVRVQCVSAPAWHADYFNFLAGPPPMADYHIPKGVSCKPATLRKDLTLRQTVVAQFVEFRKLVK